MGDSTPLHVSSTATKPAPELKIKPGASKRSNLTPWLRDWHRRAGLFAFIFMGWLGSSGILINQSPSWGYDTDRIHWAWVMWLYGLEPQPPTKGFHDGGHWLAVTPEGTVLDGRLVEPPVKLPVGLVMVGGDSDPLLFVANADHVAVISRDGRRFDELRPPILPIDHVAQIGSLQDVPNAVVVRSPEGTAFQTLDGGNRWSPVQASTVIWSVEGDLPPAEQERLLSFSRPYVTLEHILVDAHSGAIFGRGGVYVINAVGLAAVFLSFTGVWMWWRTGRRR